MIKLLWIDDDESLTGAWAPVFRKKGFTVLRASGVTRALAILQRRKLDGVLLDVRLAGNESGLEFLEYLHAHNPSLKVVVLTGFPAYVDKVLATQLGAAVYLEKPIPPPGQRQDDFFAALRALFVESGPDNVAPLAVAPSSTTAYVEEGKLVPKPPETLEKIKWLLLYGRSHLAYVLAATLILVAVPVAAMLAPRVIDRILAPSDTPSPKVSVPAITVRLSNSGQKAVAVASRGDFYLWLPGPDARYLIGKYEFHEADGDVPDTGAISVEPNTTVTVYGQILNQELYGELLRREEYDITLHVRQVNGKLTLTQDLPFTREAIEKYLLTADVRAD